jgi:hypothetical protein
MRLQPTSIGSDGENVFSFIARLGRAIRSVETNLAHGPARCSWLPWMRPLASRDPDRVR